MSHLYQVLAAETQQWSEAEYPSEDYPVIGEILDYQTDQETGGLRYLRTPQLRALEVYWYLRVVKGTPHVFDLYRDFYHKPTELLGVLGLDHDEIRDYAFDEGLDGLWRRLQTDDNFVLDFRLQALRESLTLDYPSYIFALAMGAGKTVLIGAIIATEFAMTLEYPEADFAHNALVFAPGKTILEALRELLEVPYDRILPPRLYKPFAASVKLTFTRDGETDIPAIGGSSFNLIVTNTEKIRITAETIRKGDLGSLFANAQTEEEAKRAVANRRLQTIASLPRLAIFSDEAHHLYGQSLDTRLKRVRQTVDYLAENTQVICVVNTTGTPYYKRQPLKDVVIWYGLSEGIRHDYLKGVAGNIQGYNFAGKVEQYAAHVVRDFFADYGEVRLPNGAPAKLAMYFPQTDDLAELRPVIDQALVEVGQSPALCLVNTSDGTLTRQENIDAFNRLNDPDAPHRVILLVNKGTEGWNCPSLFACALVRKLTSSNNFVLQAASRCLRQVRGNTRKARVYLSQDNFGILDRQLQETYGETIADLNRELTETRRDRIVLRKLDIPPLVVTQMMRTVVPKEAQRAPLQLQRPTGKHEAALRRRNYDLIVQQATRQVLHQVGETITIETVPETVDCYTAAVNLAASYRLNVWEAYGRLRDLYDTEDIPLYHLPDLARQIEEQTCNYEVHKARKEVDLALVKPEGFEREIDDTGVELYTAKITYHKDRKPLLLHCEDLCDNQGNFGFHYTPYNFDSKSLLDRIIRISSDPGDLVLDCFIGSGTTAAVAQKLGRRWIGCDINKGAIQTTSKRLQTIIQEQIGAQGKLVDSEDAPPEPAQLSFTFWRVNDYDLQIQHNEAVNLACEHIGIQRTRTDPFFDGTLGRNLAKIIPFNHPLSPLDLEEIRRELEARSEEDRNITVVCLGKELAADAWVEDWNRLRKGTNAFNRIELIELRTDPRYGKFFEHKPASAKVKITRRDTKIHVEIEDFVSPTIIERLAEQSGILKPQIEDWRAMVDCVMIDPAYEGEVFQVVLSDVPEKKNDLVEGHYTLPASHGSTTVALKIIDMLGEEVLLTERA